MRNVCDSRDWKLHEVNKERLEPFAQKCFRSPWVNRLPSSSFPFVYRWPSPNERERERVCIQKSVSELIQHQDSTRAVWWGCSGEVWIEDQSSGIQSQLILLFVPFWSFFFVFGEFVSFFAEISVSRWAVWSAVQWVAGCRSRRWRKFHLITAVCLDYQLINYSFPRRTKAVWSRDRWSSSSLLATIANNHTLIVCPSFVTLACKSGESSEVKRNGESSERSSVLTFKA